MKELSIQELENTSGGSWAFFDAVACGYGLATAATIVGALIASYGCSRLLTSY